MHARQFETMSEARRIEQLEYIAENWDMLSQAPIDQHTHVSSPSMRLKCHGTRGRTRALSLK